MAFPSCERFSLQFALRASSRALARAGNNMPAKMAMIAMTTKSSMRVKADSHFLICFHLLSIFF